MKIAFCGSDDENRKSVIKSFISQWPMYATPSQDIFTDTEWPAEAHENLNESKEKLNELEQVLFSKLVLLETQMEKYKDQGYIVYNGSGVDILVNALVLCEDGLVSEEFVEKIIYHNKKMLRELDVIYFIPNNKINENSSYENIHLENVYWNFYENFQTEFDSSPFFDQKNCASILLLESTSPINEIKMLLDKNGNLEGTSQGGNDGDLIDAQKLKKALRNNPQLLEMAMQSLKHDAPLNSGSIVL